MARAGTQTIIKGVEELLKYLVVRLTLTPTHMPCIFFDGSANQVAIQVRNTVLKLATYHNDLLCWHMLPPKVAGAGRQPKRGSKERHTLRWNATQTSRSLT
ncbi:unnamed protein product [Polarella glacialis]|uniref:Uncharacterized protein n=1 Tax=Polarella glacialis TaxID=89957 RepID=A0A813I5K9_POLGL|nr:unnamed protein product [Polarella glacialis]